MELRYPSSVPGTVAALLYGGLARGASSCHVDVEAGTDHAGSSYETGHYSALGNMMSEYLCVDCRYSVDDGSGACASQGLFYGGIKVRYSCASDLLYSRIAPVRLCYRESLLQRLA